MCVCVCFGGVAGKEGGVVVVEQCHSILDARDALSEMQSVSPLCWMLQLHCRSLRPFVCIVVDVVLAGSLYSLCLCELCVCVCVCVCEREREREREFVCVRACVRASARVCVYMCVRASNVRSVVVCLQNSMHVKRSFR